MMSLSTFGGGLGVTVVASFQQLISDAEVCFLLVITCRLAPSRLMSVLVGPGESERKTQFMTKQRIAKGVLVRTKLGHE